MLDCQVLDCRCELEAAGQVAAEFDDVGIAASGISTAGYSRQAAAVPTALAYVREEQFNAAASLHVRQFSDVNTTKSSSSAVGHVSC